jgi:uncharacterized protein YbjT (DUF2867 family)
MKIVVNSGNIGTPVAINLARAGAEVSLAVRAPKPNSTFDGLGIRQVSFDINRVDSMVAALEGADAFFSLTPLVENFVEAGRLSITAAQQAGVKKIVRSSAQGAEPNAAIALGRWHYAVEQAIEESGIPFTVLRPGHFMQNYLTYGTPQTIQAQNAFYSPVAAAKMTPIDTGDISAAAAQILMESGHDGKRYVLTGGESLNNDKIAELISEALGRTITHVQIPESAAVDAMQKAGTPPWLVKLLSELNELTRSGYFAEVQPDAEMILKRKPVLFNHFIRENLSVFSA